MFFFQRQKMKTKKKAISLMDEIWQNLILPITIFLVFWENFDFLLNEEKNCSRAKKGLSFFVVDKIEDVCV